MILQNLRICSIHLYLIKRKHLSGEARPYHGVFFNGTLNSGCRAIDKLPTAFIAEFLHAYKKSKYTVHMLYNTMGGRKTELLAEMKKVVIHFFLGIVHVIVPFSCLDFGVFISCINNLFLFTVYNFCVLGCCIVLNKSFRFFCFGFWIVQFPK